MKYFIGNAVYGKKKKGSRDMKYEDVDYQDLQEAYEKDGLISVCDGDKGVVANEEEL